MADAAGMTSVEHTPVEVIKQIVDRYLSILGTTPYEHADVVLDDLTVEGAGRGVQAAPTVRTAATSLIGLLDPRTYIPRDGPSRPLLHGFSGVIKGGEMLLVIGKPGSGCSTFLKSMCNMRDEYKNTSGTITYGGETADGIMKDRPGDIVFCAEEDDHFPTLTVGEVLRFAVRSRWGRKPSTEQVEAGVERLAEMVGLQHVLQTKVGNAYIRGVSGGERRRVSLAEAIATCARCICLDSPTNGLDSSTTTEFLQMMRTLTDTLNCATAMSIYQGSNAIVPLFDKILVISHGRQIYMGPASSAKRYFENLGFECPPTTTITDFLNSMTAGPEARIVKSGFRGKAPTNALEFETAFRAHELWSSTLSDIETSKSRSAQASLKKNVSYALPLYYQIWLCAWRQARIFITDYNTWGVEAICTIVQSLVLGTLFRNQQRETSSFFILASALFYAALVPALQSMAEFQNTFAQQGLILKHKRYRFYRPMAYAFGLIVTDLGWKVIAILYNMPLYWLTGFQRTPGHFFFWFFTVYVEHMALSLFFRSLAVLSPNANKAVLPVGIMFNCFVLYTGLYVPPPQMQVWLSWLRFLNPLYYAFESLMINEFSSLIYTCSQNDLAPNGPNYNSIANQVCAVAGASSGSATVAGSDYLRAQYGFKTSDKWRNVGINAALFVAFAICTGIGMEILRVPAGRLATVFYKAEPKHLSAAKVMSSSDTEIGDADDRVPPLESNKEWSSASQDSPSDQTEENTFTWSDICVDLKVGDSQKRLLDNIDGWVEGGQLLALMGVSGAGKTTLLNCLAGRLTFGTISGDLLLNGQALPKSFSRYMGYVQQQDIHLPTQTVREALQLTAQLRRPGHISEEEKNNYVESVIEMLEMTDFADALIGTPGAGLNLQQRKQVTIGVELAGKPDILFLDEPSSGLDGQSAMSIIRLLRKLANSKQAVVCTIHQPAAGLMDFFDSLLLLVKGGKTAYHGPLGKSCSEALAYFATHGRPCGETENPAEYFLDVIGAGSRNAGTKDWANIWRTSTMREKQTAALTAKASATDQAQLSAVKFGATYGASFMKQLQVVFKRTWMFYWREPDYATSKLWMNVGNALLNSLTYLQSPTTERGAYNRVFSAFMSLIVGPPLGLQVQPRFVALRDIFVHREKASLTYNWGVFVISAIAVELPYAFVTSLVYWLLWYFPVGYFYESNRAGYSFLMYELFAVFATSLAQLCASIMPTLSAAFMANGFFFMYCNTFAGTLSPKPVTPAGWRWYYNVSPLYYLGEGVTVDVLQDLQITCSSGETSIFDPPTDMSCGNYAQSFLDNATGYLVNPGAVSGCEYCRYKDGQSYYTQYGYEWGNRYRNIGIFIGFIAFNYTMVLLVTYLTRVRKWKRD